MWSMRPRCCSTRFGSRTSGTMSLGFSTVLVDITAIAHLDRAGIHAGIGIIAVTSHRSEAAGLLVDRQDEWIGRMKVQFAIRLRHEILLSDPIAWFCEP